MPNDIPLRCKCGAVRGRFTDYRRERSNRVTCYCDDCQAFARWLGRTDVLDAHGGSDIVQVAPAALSYDTGAEHLRCMQLGPKGPYRWYTACCKQPAGNTLGRARSPFAGVVAGMIDVPAGSTLDALVGPSIGGLHGRFAVGGCPPGVDAKISFGLLWQTAKPLLKNWLGGRSLPSPFVRADETLVSPSEVITREARAALYGR